MGCVSARKCSRNIDLLTERKAGKCLSLDKFMVDLLEVSDIIFDVCSRNSESLSYNGIKLYQERLADFVCISMLITHMRSSLSGQGAS